jgi:hypothetical protein
MIVSSQVSVRSRKRSRCPATASSWFSSRKWPPSSRWISAPGASSANAVHGQRLFYREAGPRDAPAVVLLHGFPASSFMFRE